MGKVPSKEVFDVPLFRNHVVAYIERWNLTPASFAMQSTVNHQAVKGFLADIRPLTLYMACSLATACDLSLDKYIKESVGNGKRNATGTGSRIEGQDRDAGSLRRAM